MLSYNCAFSHGWSLMKKKAPGSEIWTMLVQKRDVRLFHSYVMNVFNTPIYQWDRHFFNKLLCSSLKSADTKKTWHEMFSLFTMNILHWKVELNNGKGTALLPQINSHTYTRTHAETQTHTVPLSPRKGFRKLKFTLSIWGKSRVKEVSHHCRKTSVLLSHYAKSPNCCKHPLLHSVTPACCEPEHVHIVLLHLYFKAYVYPSIYCFAYTKLIWLGN